MKFVSINRIFFEWKHYDVGLGDPKLSALNSFPSLIGRDVTLRMIDGFFVTVHLAILIVVSGIVIGFALAVLRAFQIKPVNWFMVFWVYFFRAVPPLVILIIFYFAFPYIGIRLSGFVAVYISMSLVLAAFAEEIFWAGILSVDKGHWEAARSTGLGFAAEAGWVDGESTLVTSLRMLGETPISVAVRAVLWRATTKCPIAVAPSARSVFDHENQTDADQ